MGNSAMTAAAPQHLRALDQANRVRLARAELKRRVLAGEITAAEVILTCPWEAGSMEISDLLMSQRRWGRARSRRLLVSLGLPENKKIGTLTQRQRLALGAGLARNGGPAPEGKAAERNGSALAGSNGSISPERGRARLVDPVS